MLSTTRRFAALAIALSLCGAHRAPAQQPQQPLVRRTLDSATVIRLHLPTSQREVGKLLAPFGTDSTMLRYCRYPAPPCRMGGLRYVERPAANVLTLEIHLGTARNRYALIGGLVGAGLGIPLRAFAEAMEERDLPLSEEIGIVAGTAAVFALIGALIGVNIHYWGAAF